MEPETRVAFTALAADTRGVLHGIEGRSPEFVGIRLGVTAQNAAVRYHRALKRLRERIPESVFDDLVE